MKKIVISLVIASVFASGCATVNPQTGKEETSAGKSAGLGAVIGAVAGGLIGGKKGVLIGAALGGGAGYLAGLELRRTELENAKQTAAVIQRDTGFVPAVYTRTYTDKTNQQTAEGLQKMEIAAPVKETVVNGRLNPKAAGAYSKLNGMADQKEGNLVIAVPATTTKAVLDDIKAAAPNATIITGTETGKIVATLNPRKDEVTV